MDTGDSDFWVGRMPFTKMVKQYKRNKLDSFLCWCPEPTDEQKNQQKNHLFYSLGSKFGS